MSDHDFGYGQLSNPGNQIANRLASLDGGVVSANFFAALLGLNTSTVSQYLQGKKSIPSDVMSLMVSLLKDLGALIEKIRPFHLDFRPARAGEYRGLLRKLRDSEMFVNIWEVADTPESRQRQRTELEQALIALGGQDQESEVRQPDPETEPIRQPDPEPKTDPPVKPRRSPGPRTNNFG